MSNSIDLVDKLCETHRDGGILISPGERISRFIRLMGTGDMPTLTQALPLILNLKGSPYTLKDHAPFEELFRFKMPNTTTYKTGRQVGKTATQASSGITKSASIPNRWCVAPYNTLYVTPLFEQIRRFSAMYVQPFINTSPVKRLWSDSTTVSSVLHKSFINGSQMLFSFALLDADRIRGVAADEVNIDEIQDMNRDHLPIIAETLSHSQWSIRKFTGTPKTLDNTLQGLWEESSQAEWFVPCFHCTSGGKPTWNIPTEEFHLLDMIGPWHPHISEKHPATICYKCRQPISPRFGRWLHRYDDRRWEHAGFHIPQIIMPLHFANPEKWSVLLAKQQGKGNTPTNVFFNEVLGESYDTSSKLVTLTELNKASCLWPNTDQAGRDHIGGYKMKVLGVDWGGGGESGVSFTCLSLVGMRFDGKLDCIWGKRLLTPHDHIREAKETLQYIMMLKPQIVAHDYTGAGTIRETLLVQAGVPRRVLMPCQMVRSAVAAPCYHVAPTDHHPRDHYRVDKSRSLLLTCACIKMGHLRFFQPDFISDSDRGLIRDFLALTEEKIQTQAAGEIYKIGRAEGFTDDFAQATNLACVALWHMQKSWPDLAQMAEFTLTKAQLEAAGPVDPQWDGMPQ